MRKALINYLTEQAEQDSNLYLVVGDVGFSVVEEFQKQFPTRFINAGIAEQNMIGMAAGLAMAGKNVYIYTFIPFLVMRGFEQIRDDICYQKLPVRLIGLGGGFSYGAMGTTHHAIEDVALMRSLPGMNVISPASIYEMVQLVPQINQVDGPVYVRLSTTEGTISYPPECRVTFGRAVDIIPNDHAYLIATGNALDLAFQVYQQLKEQSIDIGLASMPTIKPLDLDFFRSKKLDAIFTLEEHSVIGGLGEALSMVLYQYIDKKVIFHSFAVPDCYPHTIGTRRQLQEQMGLAVGQIAKKVVQLIAKVVF